METVGTLHVLVRGRGSVPEVPLPANVLPFDELEVFDELILLNAVVAEGHRTVDALEEKSAGVACGASANAALVVGTV